MAHVVAWTLKLEDKYEDHYVVFEDFAEAVKSYDMLGSEDDVWCVALTKVMDATVPHWMDVTDGPSVEQENQYAND